MKKIYLKPEMELIEEEMNQQILAGSAPALGGDFGSGDPVLSSEFTDDFNFNE